MLGSLAALLVATAPAVNVTPSQFRAAKEPQMAIAADHKVYVAYGMADGVYTSSSSDEGATYSAPVKVGELPKLALGMRRGPRIAVHKGIVTISAISHESGDLVSFRSADGGKSWAAPVRVNDVATSAREGLHGMAASPDGTLACTWLDLRGKGTTLYLSTSKDGGRSWSRNRLVYASPGGTICQCCHPSIAFGPVGKLFVMFRNCMEGARDMYLTNSSDGGTTWSAPLKLGQGTWAINACPMDGGAFTFNSKGEVEAVWRREEKLYRTVPGASETLLGVGRQGWLTSGIDGTYIAWAEGKRILAATPSEEGLELAPSGSDVVVASSPDKKLVVAAWSGEGIQSRVLRR